MKRGLAGSLDTNILLRLLLNDIPAQHEIAKNILKSTTKQFIVSDVAILEMVFALESYYQFRRPQVADAVAAVLELEQLNCNRPLLAGVAQQYLEHPKLSFDDCYLAEYARLNGAEPLLTFDKKLVSQHTSAELAE